MDQHNFIRLEEFFSSWDKEYDQLNNIDYAMFHLINLLGQDLENTFFKSDMVRFDFALTHDEISDFSFSIVDTLEVFLNNQCLNCPVKCFMMPDAEFKEQSGIPTIVKNVLKDGKPKNVDALAIDLLNYVINPIVSKFFKAKRIEGNDYDMFLYRLKKFLEQQLIYHITDTFNEYLTNPLSTANTLFDELKHFDRLFDTNIDSLFKSAFDNTLSSGISNVDEPWMEKVTESDKIVEDFVDSVKQSFRSTFILDRHSKCIKTFTQFIDKKIKTFQIRPEYIDEFFLKDFFHVFTMVDENQIKYYFIIFAKFFRWYDDDHGTDLSLHFSSFCGNYKKELLRCQNFLYHYVKDYDITSDLFDDDMDIITGKYRVKHISKMGLLLLEDVVTKELHHLVRFELRYLIHLKEGDIIDARLKKGENYYRIKELIRIFPKMSIFYIS